MKGQPRGVSTGDRWDNRFISPSQVPGIIAERRCGVREVAHPEEVPKRSRKAPRGESSPSLFSNDLTDKQKERVRQFIVDNPYLNEIQK